MLQSLLELSHDLEAQDASLITPLGYANVGIRWIVPLDDAGNLLRVPYRTSAGSDDAAKRMVAPDVVRAASVKPKLLADNGEYTFGIGRDPNDAKVAKRHAAYLALLRECAESTGSSDVLAILTFLQGLELVRLGFDEAYEPSERVTFEVGDRLPFRDPEIARYWAETVIVDPEGPRGEGLLSGATGPIMTTEPTKIKGVPGGHTAGTNLVSGNADAFLSYGASQSLIAPILIDHADRYAKALNYLLQTDKHHLRIGGDLVYVFWANGGWVPPVKAALSGRGEDEFESLYAESEPAASPTIRSDPEDVSRLIASMWSGPSPGSGDTDEAFHAVGLSASGSRVIVRHRTHTTVSRVRMNLQNFVTRAAMVARDGTAGEPVGTFALAASVYQDARKQMGGSVPTAIVRHALDEAPLPATLLDAVVRRNRTARAVTRPRAMLARLVLTSMEVDMHEMDQLKPERPEAAYHLGRLLAVLDDLQYQALGNVNATVVDRFYGACSTAPASILGRLMQSAQDYVAKVRSKHGHGAGIRAEQSISEVLVNVNDVPDILDTRAQALFSLGFYHERAAHWKSIREAKEARSQEVQK